MRAGKYLIYISCTSLLIGFSFNILPLLYQKYFISHGFFINKLKYPVLGIDVSMHTGKINWTDLKSNNIDFVFIKASEGSNYEDPKFKLNFKGAKEAGLKTGAYHFYRFNKDGKVQAKNFLDKINQLELDFPPVLDVEEWGNHDFQNKKTAQLIKEIGGFIEEVESGTGKKVIIYTNESTYKKYIRGNFDENMLWICTFGKPENSLKWTFWQYVHDGKLKGAEGKVDINTFNGSRKEWMRFVEESKLQ